VSGEGLGDLAAKLERTRGIDMVAPFGTSLHVSGRDAAALETAIASYRHDPRFRWERSQPSLEDVFIDLMGRARDNFQDAA
jgi:ABC-2 type transport system ATP-binding protein